MSVLCAFITTRLLVKCSTNRGAFLAAPHRHRAVLVPHHQLSSRRRPHNLSDQRFALQAGCLFREFFPPIFADVENCNFALVVPGRKKVVLHRVEEYASDGGLGLSCD